MQVIRSDHWIVKGDDITLDVIMCVHIMGRKHDDFLKEPAQPTDMTRFSFPIAGSSVWGTVT